MSLSHMENPGDGSLGLVVLYNGEAPSVDVVAVHGLGANPAWAWIRKVEVEGSNQHKKVNWLADKDLLPAKIPHARIMTFNYESTWHKDAPKQRRALCAEQLLTALDNRRKEEKDTKYRPIIFVGHSFGGIVIAQALVSANSRGETFQYLATSTVGIVFLGTPHRGTKASKWGEWVAYAGKTLGLNMSDAILKDLREDSETLNDLLYEFTLWLFRMSVLTVCFFETHKTDYGRKVGGSWKEMVVEEKSACIDGHRKMALPTDHFKINKYEGPEDYSFTKVYSVIKEMVEDAMTKVQQRLKPQPIIHDNSIIPRENLSCLRSLFLTNPLDDLTAIRRSKGKRVEGTCEWLLLHEEYTSWLVEGGPRMLQLIGGPGIGKTMVASYLVEELEKKAQFTSNMTFAYYFCDNKDDKRNTAIAIIRGLLLQLLRQKPLLFKHIQEDYAQMGVGVFDNFDALWRILLKMLTDPKAGHIYFLIDALDECDKPPRGFRQAFLASLADWFSIHQESRKLHVKLLITSRPNSDILDKMKGRSRLIRIDSAKINADLFKFIQTKVDELSRVKDYPLKLKEDVKKALSEKAEGTFLWVSLVLEDISNSTVNSMVRKKLQSLPSSLGEVYGRILDNIQEEDVENARFILQWVVIARRPLNVDELAMGRALGPEGWDMTTVPTADTLDELKDGFKICEPLVYLDTDAKTINLVHQSAKDYLLEINLHGNSYRPVYRVIPDKANSCTLNLCWRYLSMEEFSQDTRIIKNAVDNRLKDLSPGYLETHCFLRYAILYWVEHALAASPAVITDFAWESGMLKRLALLRDQWLRSAAEKGDNLVVEKLLAANADVNAPAGKFDDRTALHAAAGRGHLEVVERLLTANADVNAPAGKFYGRTALHAAAENGHLEVVERLLTANADVNAPAGKDYGRTALEAAAGHEAVMRVLQAAVGSQ